MTPIHRCAWCGTDPLYVAYHDTEWGVPEYDARGHVTGVQDHRRRRNRPGPRPATRFVHATDEPARRLGQQGL